MPEMSVGVSSRIIVLLIQKHYTSDVAQVKSHLAALKAKGGGDEPQSLLDAMYKVSQWSTSEQGASPYPTEWRHRRDARRTVIIFTCASCKPTFSAADGSNGSVYDLVYAYHANKFKVCLFAPDAPQYADLSEMYGLEWEAIGTLDVNPQQALNDYASKTNLFMLVRDCFAPRMAMRAED
jgi:hypothetical protein